MTDERIRECEALCEAATPGPWVDDGDRSERVYPADERDAHDWICECEREQDRAFIAAARTALPEALTALREAKAREEALRGLLRYWYEHRKGHDDDAPCVICHETRAALEMK